MCMPSTEIRSVYQVGFTSKLFVYSLPLYIINYHYCFNIALDFQCRLLARTSLDLGMSLHLATVRYFLSLSRTPPNMIMLICATSFICVLNMYDKRNVENEVSILFVMQDVN